MSDDQDVHGLLVRLKQGDLGAVDALYGSFAAPFYRYARGRGLPHEVAEEVRQEAFVRILKGARTYNEDHRGGAAWLWSVCRNAAVDAFRAHRVPETPMDPANPDHEGAAADDPELGACIARAFAQLSPAERGDIRWGDPGRGTGRGPWRAAVERFRAALIACYGDLPGS
jgi:RNA polymerase sigma factor (sigma-70 family)